MKRRRIIRHDTCETLAKFERRLRAGALPREPVTVRLKVGLHARTGHLGETSRSFNHRSRTWEYAIDLDAELPPIVAADTIMHEWAHTLSWNIDPDHSAAWGAAFARCYRVAVEGKGSKRRR